MRETWSVVSMTAVIGLPSVLAYVCKCVIICSSEMMNFWDLGLMGSASKGTQVV